jgi:hypothetical protein
MAVNRSKLSFYRKFLALGALSLSWSAACGSNPEVRVPDHAVSGPGGLGDACSDDKDCSASLRCGKSRVCVSACGDVTGTMACGAEACLPDGQCSQGLGRNCASNDDCHDGLICSELGHCAVPCDPGAEAACKGGAACRSSGTCPTDGDVVIGVGGAPSEPGAGGDGSGGGHDCIDVSVDFTPQIPTVVLLIDRSGSMNDGDGFGDAVAQAVTAGTYELGDCPDITVNRRTVNPNNWRWNVVRDVLMNPTKGIIPPLEGSVRFGMSLYTSDQGNLKVGSFPIEVDPNKVCPQLIDVPFALNNYQPMLDAFKCSDIAHDTPTGESLQAAAERLKAFKEPGPKVIVLATDGEPDSCDCPNFSGAVPAQCKVAGYADTVKAQVVGIAKQIHGEDVTVHVINVSTPSKTTLQEHLKQVADAGGGNVYPGFSPGALTAAFDDIINGARSCVIDLNGEIAQGKESSGVVTLDGDELQLDDKKNGWHVNSPSQIELLGKACDAIKSGKHDLAIRFPCQSFKPIVVH